MTATLFPTRYSDIEVRFGTTSPQHTVYMRRRLAVGLVAVALVSVVGLAAHTVLADRGGVPASIPAIRPASAAAAVAGVPIGAPAVPAVAPAVIAYVVQPGDTLWSLAAQFRGDAGISQYVDVLVTANGGSTLQPGQVLLMP